MNNRSQNISQQDDYIDHVKSRGRVHPEQTVLYHQGDGVSGFYRVNSGIVMVYRLLPDSQRQISGFYTQGDFFGLSSSDAHPDTAVTVSTANIVMLTLHDIRQSIALQKTLFDMACSQLDTAQTLITTLTKRSAAEKVATFLVMLSQRQGQQGVSFDIRLPMSRQDIADYLGLSIETVSRMLTKLKDGGVIHLPNRNTIHICDYIRLKIIAREKSVQN
ncbi:helix-turn-helix domain-containing protein [Robiginitomaculum antarcticum]|uniref:helix-turn-helix domain-containing protein n=1 Tax=Robiginitomaculum antarcticum TaxID=437507 RepID=UPI0003752A7A|nr:helix-turn-helix domain-containing protein [Robiginitomaculum antarcticum]